MGKFAKQIMVLGSGNNSFQTSTANGISGNFDIDEIAGTLSFALPYKDQAIKNLKKNDTILLYFGYFNSDPGDITVDSTQKNSNGLQRVFTGYIDAIKLNKSKTSYTYTVEAKGTLALGNERNTERKVAEVNEPLTLINTILQLGGMQNGSVAQAEEIDVLIEIIPESDVVQYISPEEQELYIRVKGGKSVKEMIDDIKKRFSLIIHQTGDGIVNIMTHFMISTNPKDDRAWEFRLDTNMFELDYGDLTSDINSVVVIGRPPVVGMAVDVFAVETAAGDRPIQKSDYRWRIYENRDLISDEDCEKVARNKLLEISRNHYITFKTQYEPDFEVGQAVRIWDDDKFDGRIFIIKNFTFNIDKGDVSCDITAFANSLQLLPEELVISPTGINDVDSLDIEKQAEDAFNWAGGLG